MDDGRWTDKDNDIDNDIDNDNDNDNDNEEMHTNMFVGRIAMNVACKNKTISAHAQSAESQAHECDGELDSLFSAS